MDSYFDFDVTPFQGLIIFTFSTGFRFASTCVITGWGFAPFVFEKIFIIINSFLPILLLYPCLKRIHIKIKGEVRQNLF